MDVKTIINLFNEKENKIFHDLKLKNSFKSVDELCISTLMYSRNLSEKDLKNKLKKLLFEYVSKIDGDKDFLYGICLGITNKISNSFYSVTMDCVDYVHLIINEKSFKEDFYILLDGYFKGTVLHSKLESLITKSSNKVNFGLLVVSKLDLNKGILPELNDIIDDDLFELSEREFLHRLEVLNSSNHNNRKLLIDKIIKYETNVIRKNPFEFKLSDIEELNNELKVLPRMYKTKVNNKSLLVNISELYVSTSIKERVIVIEIKYDLNNHKNKRMTLFLGADYLFCYNNKEVKLLKTCMINKTFFNSYFNSLLTKDSVLSRSEHAFSDIISIVSKRLGLSSKSFDIRKFFKKEDNLRIESVENYFNFNSSILNKLGLEYSISELQGEKVLMLKNILEEDSNIFIFHPSFIFNKSKLEYKYIRKSTNSIIKDYVSHLKLAYKDADRLGYDFTNNQLKFIATAIEKSFRLTKK